MYYDDQMKIMLIISLDFIPDYILLSLQTKQTSSEIMSGLVTGLLTRLTTNTFLNLQQQNLEVLSRNASKKAGASTRNKCRNTPGKRRGIKIYDGQRIPHG